MDIKLFHRVNKFFEAAQQGSYFMDKDILDIECRDKVVRINIRSRKENIDEIKEFVKTHGGNPVFYGAPSRLMVEIK